MIASAIMVADDDARVAHDLEHVAIRGATFEKYEERNHELRMALGRVVADFEAAYLSKNEDINAEPPAHDDGREAGRRDARRSGSRRSVIACCGPTRTSPSRR